jgi:hypothetical protein
MLDESVAADGQCAQLTRQEYAFHPGMHLFVQCLSIYNTKVLC